MAIIEYEGQLPSGRAISGTLEAEDIPNAKSQLESMGIHGLSLNDTAAMPPTRPLSREDLQFFNQQLASMAETGIALDEGLRILAQDLDRGKLRTVVEDLANDLQSGIPLEDAIQRRGNLFPPLYADIIRSGITNHRLGSTLCNLNSHLAVMDATRRLVWESAIYPIILLVFGLAVMTLIMTALVPGLEAMVGEYDGYTYYDWETYQDVVVEFSFLTRTLFTLSHHWWYVFAGIVLLVLAGIALFTVSRYSPQGRRFRETLLRWTPGLSGVYRASLMARFSQAAALGANAGHDLPLVLRLAAGATGHEGLTRDAENISNRIETGESIITPERKTRFIPAIFCYAAQIAGQRGQLSAALAEMARNYDALARHRLVMLRLVLTPCLILLLAGLFGLGILGVFMPMVQVVTWLSH